MQMVTQSPFPLRVVTQGRINLVKEGSDAILSFKTPPDYETKTEYNFVIEASDGTNVAYQGILINIIDVVDENATPVFTSQSEFSVRRMRRILKSFCNRCRW